MRRSNQLAMMVCLAAGILASGCDIDTGYTYGGCEDGKVECKKSDNGDDYLKYECRGGETVQEGNCSVS